MHTSGCDSFAVHWRDLSRGIQKRWAQEYQMELGSGNKASDYIGLGQVGQQVRKSGLLNPKRDES